MTWRSHFLKQLPPFPSSTHEEYLPSPLHQLSCCTPWWGFGTHFQSHWDVQAGSFLDCSHTALQALLIRFTESEKPLQADTANPAEHQARGRRWLTCRGFRRVMQNSETNAKQGRRSWNLGGQVCTYILIWPSKATWGVISMLSLQQLHCDSVKNPPLQSAITS